MADFEIPKATGRPKFTPTAPAHPVCILKIVDNKIVINAEEFCEILDKVGNRPFAIYSINGRKRTGKSFLLNYFLRYLDSDKRGNWLAKESGTSFDWRGGTNVVTTGIHIWSVPLKTFINGKQIDLLLMDTQGLFDEDTTFEQNATIFAISAILSSVFIFNVIRDIDEHQLQILQYFGNNANTNSTGSTTPEKFQRLVILIRDFEYADYKYGYYTEKSAPTKQKSNFMVEKLISHQNQPKDVQATHQQILNRFETAGIYLMATPGKNLKRYDSINNPDREFQECLKQFVELMIANENVVKKQVKGVEMTGIDFKPFVRALAKAEFSKIQDLTGLTANVQYQAALSSTLDLFQTELANFLCTNQSGVTDQQLRHHKDSTVEKCKSFFKTLPILPAAGFDPVKKFSEEFLPEANELFKAYVQQNQELLKIKADAKEQSMKIKEREAQFNAATQEKIAVEQRNHEEKTRLQRQLDLENYARQVLEARSAILEKEKENLRSQLN